MPETTNLDAKRDALTQAIDRWGDAYADAASQTSTGEARHTIAFRELRAYLDTALRVFEEEAINHGYDGGYSDGQHDGRQKTLEDLEEIKWGAGGWGSR